MDKWYVILDEDGLFITQTPANTDEIKHTCDTAEEAEAMLSREASRGD